MSPTATDENTLLRIKGLSKNFPIKKPGGLGRYTHYVRAVNGVDLTIARGETLALVGESGSGKSTIGRLILRLLEATEGEISFQNIDLLSLSKEEMRTLRKQLQIIPQDPSGALNPRMTIAQALAEPFVCHDVGDSSVREHEIDRLLETVGLDKNLKHHFPHELSGGQRQRVCIARAIALKPQFIVCDEAISSLDVSYQAQIVNLLSDLQEKFQLTYLFISHDLRIVRHFANRIAVLYFGKIVELADIEQFFPNPAHPYSQALLSSNPALHTGEKPAGHTLKGEPPDPSAPPSGCAFRTRCPLAESICASDEPMLIERTAGHFSACHITNREFSHSESDHV